MIQVKVERDYIGFMAYDKEACLCPECHAVASGSTIQWALEAWEEMFDYEKYNYTTPPYKWN